MVFMPGNLFIIKNKKQLFKKYFEIYFILINEILIMLNIIQRIIEKQKNKGNSKVFYGPTNPDNFLKINK